MNVITADSFTGLVAIALERMAFVITEPAEITPAEVLVDVAACAAVEIANGDGGPARTILVAASAGMVREVAAGMMGVGAEEIDVDEHALATVSELANILGGELIMLLTGGDEQLSLGLPRQVSDEAAGTLVDKTGADGISVVLGGDEGRLLVVVRTN
jgi:hypothetical protein